jgi:hypothetical protein
VNAYGITRFCCCHSLVQFFGKVNFKAATIMRVLGDAHILTGHLAKVNPISGFFPFRTFPSAPIMQMSQTRGDMP